MKKRLLILVVFALVATLAFTACATTPPATSATPSPSASSTNFAPAPRAAGTKVAFGQLTDKDIKIGVSVMDLKNPFFIAVKEGSEAYAKAKGYPIQVTDSGSSAEKQLNDVESLLSTGITILDIRCLDTKAIKDELASVRAAGIAIDTYPFMEESDTLVGYNNYDQGKIEAEAAVKWIKQKYNGKCKVALLTEPASGDIMERVHGMKDVLAKEPGVQIVAEKEAFTPDTALTVTSNILQKDPEVRVFLCINDSGALGAVQAIETQDKAHEADYFVGGIDGTDDALKFISQNTAFRCSVASKYKIQEVSWLILDNLIACAKGEPYVYVVPMEQMAVDISNVAAYMAQQIDYSKLPNVYDTYKDYNWPPR
jgi:ribose transport system substrate-binding protein